MKALKFLDDGRLIECKTNSPVSSVILAGQLNIPMACGGNGVCATCHVIVEKGADQLSPIENREERALARLANRTPSSRLSCQAKVLGDVTIRLPKGIYAESLQGLDAMVGKRATRAILHPIDGRVLVEEGQIITRFIVRKLNPVDFNFEV